MILKNMRPFLFTLMVTLATGLFDGEKLTHEIASKFCPYSDFCHTKASKNSDSSKVTPCCMSCSCEADCWQTNSCCPDKQLDHHQTSNLTCAKTQIRKDSWDYDELSPVQYFLVDECPINNKNVTLRNRCSSRKPTALEDILWVSEPVTGRIFRNRHCAACHGVNKWEHWNIRTSCRETLYASISNVSSVIFSGDCSIQMVAPILYEAKLERFRCDNPDHSTCNATGLWEGYDRDIAEACGFYNLLFRQIRITFKNVFCFICNVPRSVQYIESCPRPSDEKGRDLRFSTLIQYTTKEVPPDSQCEEYGVYDKYTRLCRKLICPLGESPYYGQCQPVTRTIINFGMRINFSLVFVSNTTYLNASEGEQIMNKVLKISGLRRCNFCSADLHKDTARLNLPIADLLLRVVVATNTDCQLHYVYNKLAMMIGKKLQVVLEQQTMIFTIDIAEQRDNYDIISRIFGPGFCFSTVDLLPPFCPYIQLSYTEVESLTNEKAKGALVAFFKNAKVNITETVASVCIKDYMNIMYIGSGKEELCLMPVFMLAATFAAVILTQYA